MKNKIKGRYPAVWKIRHRSGNIRDHPQRYHINIGKRYGDLRGITLCYMEKSGHLSCNKKSKDWESGYEEETSWEDHRDKDTNEIVPFLKSELKSLERKGYTVKIVRFGDWSTFHIVKKSNLPFDSVIDSVDVIIRPASAKDRILVYKRTLDDKKYSYSYKDVEKFKKGFSRNIINKYIKKR
ncbi:hypothetical protein DRN58_08145 [Thermococci archaeon]|nr:MAG: hypothetical protein DRN58_08145 [Thermococci archaeon]